MLVRILKPFKDDRVHHRTCAYGDAVELPDDYARALMKNNIIAEITDKNVKPSLNLPKLPDGNETRGDKAISKNTDKGFSSAKRNKDE